MSIAIVALEVLENRIADLKNISEFSDDDKWHRNQLTSTRSWSCLIPLSLGLRVPCLDRSQNFTGSHSVRTKKKINKCKLTEPIEKVHTRHCEIFSVGPMCDLERYLERHFSFITKKNILTTNLVGCLCRIMLRLLPISIVGVAILFLPEATYDIQRHQENHASQLHRRLHSIRWSNRLWSRKRETREVFWRCGLMTLIVTNNNGVRRWSLINQPDFKCW